MAAVISDSLVASVSSPPNQNICVTARALREIEFTVIWKLCKQPEQGGNNS